ncbi:MAG: glycoside hydrolase family 3 protein [Chlamydiae bacterium]|nr:glycoside hydrolase family 3 protein [Chlamydiota bacterium]
MGIFKASLFYFVLIYKPLSLIGSDIFSLEEKVGQLLMVGFKGDRGDNFLARFIENCPVGGVIFYNFLNGSLDFEGTKHLSADIQSYPGIPRFIAIDQEGGRVQRCKKGFTLIPPASEWESIGHNGLVSLADSIGYELSQAGITMNFSPVVDLEQPFSSVLRGRTISRNPLVITKIARTFVEGFKTHRVMGVIKHFPGHGAAFLDSHYQTPQITKSFSRLQREDLVPFALLAPKVDAIMMGHLQVKDFDCDHIVTLSKKWHDYLRNDLKFEGLIISDSLVMQAVLNDAQDIFQACLLALKAGTDILLLGGRFLTETNQTLSFKKIQKIHRRLFLEAQADPMVKQRVEESFRRIMNAKKKLGLLKHSRFENEVF